MTHYLLNYIHTYIHLHRNTHRFVFVLCPGPCAWVGNSVFYIKIVTHMVFTIPCDNNHVVVRVSVNKTEPERHRNTGCLYVCVCVSSSHLGIVTHFVLLFCVLMAFSSSSSCPVFFSFFTKLFTAFSHHFSSCPPPFCSPTPPIPPPAPPFPAGVFFHPRRRFTTGGVKGRMEDMVACVCIRACVSVS